MKRLNEIRKQITELTAFQDPPTVLIMRRKGIRLFPNGQRVATYRNDNLDLEVAIPYNPETLGRRKIATLGTAVSEEVMNEEISRDDKIHFIRQYFKAHICPPTASAAEDMTTLEVGIMNWLRSEYNKNGDDLEDWSDDILDDNYEDLRALLGLEEETASDHLFGYYLHALQSKPGRNFSHLENHIHTRYGEHAALHFKAAGKHYVEGDTDKANHHYAKYKHEASMVGECMDKPEVKKTWNQIRKIHSNGPKKHPVSKEMNSLLTGEETKPSEEILESTIHSLHSIAKRGEPATVRFRNGSNAMVHHGTAARIMRLHSLMRKHNKRKVEALVNSSPDGLKKVVDFVDTHLK